MNRNKKKQSSGISPLGLLLLEATVCAIKEIKNSTTMAQQPKVTIEPAATAEDENIFVPGNFLQHNQYPDFIIEVMGFAPKKDDGTMMKGLVRHSNDLAQVGRIEEFEKCYFQQYRGKITLKFD